MTDYKTAKEEILGTYSLDELEPISEKGCSSGLAKNHIYYTETVKFFEKYSDEIQDYIREGLGAEELLLIRENNEGNLEGYKNDCAWTYIELLAIETVEEEKENQMTESKTAAEYLDRGCDKDDQKDSKGAIEDYSKAIELNPNYAEAYANRGCAKEELGDKEGAIADWQKASDLGDEEAAKWIKEIQAKNTKKESSLTKKEEPVKGQKLAECIVDLLENGCHDPEEVALVLGYSSLDEKGNVQPSVDALMKAIKDAGVDIENEESSEIDKFGIWDGKLCQALDSHGMKIWIPKRLYDKYPHAYEHAGHFEEVADWEDMNFPEPMMEGDLTIMKWVDRNLEFVDAFSGDDLALFNDLDPKNIHDMVGYG